MSIEKSKATKRKEGLCMRITNLEIINFRGIKNASIVFPRDERVLCLIGAGDNTKSTILQAIEWILWPSWNLSASDSDFYECDTSSPIVLRGTFSELPERLLTEDKYGLYLRNPDVPLEAGRDDEPSDNLPVCLTVQLTIDNSLEPKWEIVCNRNEPKIISLADRKSIIANKIGNNCSKDMLWGKYSVLQKYADSKGIIHDVQTSALRDIAQNADLHALDGITEMVKNIGKEYGVGFKGEVSNHMQIQGISFSTSVGLFDGKAPLSQRGLGSQRLLSMGLNINTYSNNSIILVDEIENGLEPYRLRSIINEFRLKHTATGQVIMTTHSPIAVAECTISEILIVHSVNGTTQCIPLKSGDAQTDDAMQAQIRKNAEAFLCKRVIVCEGKTEQGFIRALDSYLSKEKGIRIAFAGIGTADGGGSTALKCTKQFFSCGYEVCLFMDSDKADEKVQKEELSNRGISVFDWEEPNAIEEQVYNDIPLRLATKLISIAIDEYGLESVKNRLSEIPYDETDGYIELKDMTCSTKRSIGTIAKAKKVEWYKRIDLGESLGNVVFSELDSIDVNSKLRRVIEGIINWVICDDK